MKLFKEQKPDATYIWNYYDKGQDWHNKNNIYSNTEKFFDFYQGYQWRGLESGGETYPMYNFIQPIVDYKVAMVCMNLMSINYSALNSGADQDIYKQACEVLNEYARSKWELTKMDSKAWEIVKNACIAGDSYLFFYDRDLHSQIIDRTNVYLSDEQQTDLQKQKYIIIYERRFVEDIKEEARANGVKEEDIEKIVPDDGTDTLPENVKDNEVKTGEKCSCLLYMARKKQSAPYAEEYGVYIARSTQSVIYQEEKRVVGRDENGQEIGIGLTMYPMASLLWSTKRASSRGIGEVEPLINNQISTNKLLVRREKSMTISAFPKPVVNTGMVSNPDDADKAGAKILIRDTTAKASDAFAYIQAAAPNGEPKMMQDEIIQVSRDLASAGEETTGNINPEKASGAAIIAVKDQQAIASTQTVAAYKQFIEDIAAVWLDMWIAYNPNGMTVDLENEGQMVQSVIPAEVLRDLQVNIRIDVSPTNPYSKFATQQQIDNLVSNPMFQNTMLLEEYYNLIDDDNPIKGKLKDLIENRKQLEAMQEQAMTQQLGGELEQANGIIQQQQQALAEKDVESESNEKLDAILERLGG